MEKNKNGYNYYFCWMFAQICAHILFVPLATVPTLLHLCYRTFPVLKLNITKMLFNIAP